MFKKAWASVRGWFEPVYKIVYASEEPARMRDKTVYVLGEHDTPWAAVFICPCGCRAAVWLNLLKDEDRPTWTVERRKRVRAHILPSVWRQSGCRSHFFIKQGRLIWAGARDR